MLTELEEFVELIGGSIYLDNAIKEAKRYGLEQEVIEYYFRHRKAGVESEEAASLAMDEWDVGFIMFLETHYLECGFCKKQILVQIGLFGISHNIGIMVSCKECIKKNGVSKEYQKQNSEEAKKIIDWASSKWKI